MVLQSEVDLSKVVVTRPKTLWIFTFRSHITTLLCMGLMVTGLMRVSINMAMICMTVPRAPKNASLLLNTSCSNIDSNDASHVGGELDWSPRIQSQIFAAFFYGSLVGTIPSGFMADRFSPKLIFLACVVVYSIGSALTPVAAAYHYALVIAIRAVMGVTEGLIQPCVSALVARWIPPDERATVIGVYTAGNQLCMVVGMPLFAFLCSQKSFLGGWPSIYYVAAASAIPWCILWYFLISNSPEKNRHVSEPEKLYIMYALRDQSLRSRKKTKIPVVAILLSMPVWATNVACFASYLTVYMMQTYLPLYFSQVLNLNMSNNGFFTALPFLIKYLVKFVVGYGADLLTKSKKVSRTTSCKIFNSLSAFGPPVFFICCSYLNCINPGLALLYLCSAASFSSGFMAGAMTSAQALAPQLSGLIRSWNGIFNQLSGVVAPYLVAGIVKNGSRSEWQAIFFVVSGISVAAGIFYIVFGSAEIQPWAKLQQNVADLESTNVKTISWDLSEAKNKIKMSKSWGEAEGQLSEDEIRLHFDRKKSWAVINPYGSKQYLMGRRRKQTI